MSRQVLPIANLNMLNKLQGQVCRTIGPTLAGSLEPLTLDSSSKCSHFKTFLLVLYCRGSSDMAELVSLLYSCGTSSRYSDKRNDFSVTIPRC